MTDVDLLEEPRRSWKALLLIVVAIVAVLGGFGAIGHFNGTGWFGHRQFLYGSGDLYVLNLSPERRLVSVDGREPVAVEAENAQIVELIGGTSTVEILDEDGKVVETHAVTIDHSHALLNISEASCLVVADITPFYRGENKDLTFVDQLKADQAVYVPGTRNVVWPRRSFPSRLDTSDGKGLWIELVGCHLFDEPEFLQAYMDLRLQERVERMKQSQQTP